MPARERFRGERLPTPWRARGAALVGILEVINIQFASPAFSLTLQMSCANTALAVGEMAGPKAPPGLRALPLPLGNHRASPAPQHQHQPQEWCK